jgi:hypothetical protein
MQERNGARRQMMMTENAGVTQAVHSANTPVRGVIMKNGIKHFDAGDFKRTLVHVGLFDRKLGLTNSCLMNVPLLYQKMNRENGEEWTPEDGDIVAVGFFNGNLRDPFVMGYLGAESTIYTPAAKKTRSYRKRSGTSEEIDKDGNRTTIIHGHEMVTVETGDVTITTTAGKCTVTIKGKTAWTSDKIDLDGAKGAGVKGVVQGDCICPFTKKPHAMVSATVKASK